MFTPLNYGKIFLRLQKPFRFSRMLCTSNLKVQHDENANEFYITFEKDKAILLYEYIGKDVVDLYHTKVPESLRGKGIAALLAENAINFVINNNLKAKITCTYLQAYLQKNPNKEFIDRVIS